MCVLAKCWGLGADSSIPLDKTIMNERDEGVTKLEYSTIGIINYKKEIYMLSLSQIETDYYHFLAVLYDIVSQVECFLIYSKVLNLIRQYTKFHTSSCTGCTVLIGIADQKQLNTTCKPI